MIRRARTIVGWVALALYLFMGAILYFEVIPGAEGLWPPDFNLSGYDVAAVRPFVYALTDQARDLYTALLLRWDIGFAVALALWFALTGWRGGGLKYVVLGMAILYAGLDVAENLAIFRFVCLQILDPAAVKLASQLTMAKFAAAYLCALVLVWHLRRER